MPSSAAGSWVRVRVRVRVGVRVRVRDRVSLPRRGGELVSSRVAAVVQGGGRGGAGAAARGAVRRPWGCRPRRRGVRCALG